MFREIFERTKYAELKHGIYNYNPKAGLTEEEVLHIIDSRTKHQLVPIDQVDFDPKKKEMKLYSADWGEYDIDLWRKLGKHLGVELVGGIAGNDKKVYV